MIKSKVAVNKLFNLVRLDVKSIMKNCTFLFLFLATLNGCGTKSPDKDETKLVRDDQRPNILWITTEDMSPHLPSYGDSTVTTPNIDKLAREGVRYTNVYSVSGVCAPGRHALITGMYPSNTGAMHMRNWKRTSALDEIKDPELLNIPTYEAVLPPEAKCFTEFMRARGYYCTNNSKEDYQFRTPKSAWNESNNSAHWRNRPEGVPFFAVFNIMDTHESRVWKREKDPLSVDPSEVPVPPYYPDTEVIRKDIARNYNNIILMDQEVGKILDQLEEDGLSENTIVFFFSDHGSGLPRSKRWVYDSGLKVPMIIRYPNKKAAGITNNELVSFVDFAPSMLSLTDIPIPEYMQGLPFIGEQKASPRRYVFATRDRMDPAQEKIRAVRDKRFKYIRNLEPDKPWVRFLPYRDRMNLMGEMYRLDDAGKLNDDHKWFWAKSKPGEELYDTEVDPFEMNNLASDPAYIDKKKELRRALEQWQTHYRDLGLISETEVIKLLWPPKGEQPVTAAPEIEISKMERDLIRLNLTSATQGASIVYRTDTSSRWKLYHEPINIPVSAQIEVLAHRIGFKESEKVLRTFKN